MLQTADASSDSLARGAMAPREWRILILTKNEQVREVMRTAAEKYHAAHLVEFADPFVNSLGTPFLDDALRQGSTFGDVVLYVNSDIVLDVDMVLAIDHLHTHFVASAETRGPGAAGGSFLGVGRRCEILFEQQIPYEDPRETEQVMQMLRRDCAIGPTYAVDFFIFPSAIPLDVPPFLLGRGGFDNWLIHAALEADVPVVDVSEFTVGIHLNHGYCHLSREMCKKGAVDTEMSRNAGLRKSSRHPEELAHNRRLFLGQTMLGVLGMATHRLAGGVSDLLPIRSEGISGAVPPAKALRKGLTLAVVVPFSSSSPSVLDYRLHAMFALYSRGVGDAPGAASGGVAATSDAGSGAAAAPGEGLADVVLAIVCRPEDVVLAADQMKQFMSSRNSRDWVENVRLRYTIITLPGTAEFSSPWTASSSGGSIPDKTGQDRDDTATDAAATARPASASSLASNNRSGGDGDGDDSGFNGVAGRENAATLPSRAAAGASARSTGSRSGSRSSSSSGDGSGSGRGRGRGSRSGSGSGSGGSSSEVSMNVVRNVLVGMIETELAIFLDADVLPSPRLYRRVMKNYATYAQLSTRNVLHFPHYSLFDCHHPAVDHQQNDADADVDAEYALLLITAGDYGHVQRHGKLGHPREDTEFGPRTDHVLGSILYPEPGTADAASRSDAGSGVIVADAADGASATSRGAPRKATPGFVKVPYRFGYAPYYVMNMKAMPAFDLHFQGSKDGDWVAHHVNLFRLRFPYLLIMPEIGPSVAAQRQSADHSGPSPSSAFSSSGSAAYTVTCVSSDRRRWDGTSVDEGYGSALLESYITYYERWRVD